MEFQKTAYTVENGIAVLTMRYPKNLNAIDEQMAEELLCRFQDAERDDAVKVVVLPERRQGFFRRWGYRVLLSAGTGRRGDQPGRAGCPRRSGWRIP